MKGPAQKKGRQKNCTWTFDRLSWNPAWKPPAWAKPGVNAKVRRARMSTSFFMATPPTLSDAFGTLEGSQCRRCAGACGHDELSRTAREVLRSNSYRPCKARRRER